MNRNLLVFSLLLILVGIGVGFYFITFIGLLLLLPSLLSATRPPAKTGPAPTPQQPRQVPRRISPPPIIHQPPSPSSVQAATGIPAASSYPMASPSPMQSTSPMASSVGLYSGALFPIPVLPALAPIVPGPQPGKEVVPQKQGERDEIVEVGTILALLKLVLG